MHAERNVAQLGQQCRLHVPLPAGPCCHNVGCSAKSPRGYALAFKWWLPPAFWGQALGVPARAVSRQGPGRGLTSCCCHLSWRQGVRVCGPLPSLPHAQGRKFFLSFWGQASLPAIHFCTLFPLFLPVEWRPDAVNNGSTICASTVAAL